MDRADIFTEAYISRKREGAHAFLNEEKAQLDRKDFDGFHQPSPIKMETVERIVKPSAPTVPGTCFG
jgi:hypothetical protein